MLHDKNIIILLTVYQEEDQDFLSDILLFFVRVHIMTNNSNYNSDYFFCEARNTSYMRVIIIIIFE